MNRRMLIVRKARADLEREEAEVGLGDRAASEVRRVDDVPQGDRDERREDEVGQRAGRCDERLAAPAAVEVHGVDRRRLRVAEEELTWLMIAVMTSIDPADGVEMDARVERQAALPARGVVTESIGRPGVQELVDRESHEQHDDDRDERGDDRVGVHPAAGRSITGGPGAPSS